MQALTGNGRGRLVIAGVAVVAILFGFVLAGGPAPVTSSPAAKQTSSPAAEGEKEQSQGYLLRDYSEVATGSDIGSSSDWAGSYGGFAAKFLVVVALAYGSIWALRRFVLRSPRDIPEAKLVSLLGSLDLSPNRTVYVVEVGRKGLVLGATPSQISLLAEISDLEELAELRSTARQSAVGPSFLSLLERTKSQFHSTPPTVELATTDPTPVLREGRLFLDAKLASLRNSLGANGDKGHQ